MFWNVLSENKANHVKQESSGWSSFHHSSICNLGNLWDRCTPHRFSCPFQVTYPGMFSKAIISIGCSTEEVRHGYIYIYMYICIMCIYIYTQVIRPCLLPFAFIRLILFDFFFLCEAQKSQLMGPLNAKPRHFIACERSALAVHRSTSWSPGWVQRFTWLQKNNLVKERLTLGKKGSEIPTCFAFLMYILLVPSCWTSLLPEDPWYDAQYVIPLAARKLVLCMPLVAHMQIDDT